MDIVLNRFQNKCTVTLPFSAIIYYIALQNLVCVVIDASILYNIAFTN